MKTIFIFMTGLVMTAYVFGENPVEKIIQVSTSVSENPPAISFKWNPVPGQFDILVFRRFKNSVSWGSAIATLPCNTTEYTDNTVKTGIEYEYAIKAKYFMPVETYISAGMKCRETETRGKLILLVDSSFVMDLKQELTRLESDLVGDGWQVLRKDISRNASVKYVKNIILGFYYSDPENVNTVFLLGHIAVPYSGTKAYDGHTEDHNGAWPADMYYGDLNEKIWSDNWVNCTTSGRCENRNVPGDGKFDVCILPDKEVITLSVGRVDFYNLPAFPQSEVELVRSYLDKNHAFRHKIINPKMRALVDDNFGIKEYNGITEIFSISGWRNFSALLNYGNIKTGDFFLDTEDNSFIWAYGCGGGTFTDCKGIGSTSDFASRAPKTVFTALYGSRFGDWDSENNFLRSALASPGWILTSCWAGRPHYTFHQMGMGETIGYCVRTTQNNPNNSNYYAGQTNRGTHTGLLGDPTLRMHIVQPVNSLNAEITENNTILLTWNQGDDNIDGYYIYKLDTLANRYIRISDSQFSENSFEDVSPSEGFNYYMVRTLQLSHVASGSYYNLSQGIFDTVYYEQQIQPFSVFTSTRETDINEMLIYPNPSTGVFNISFGSNPVSNATIEIYNLQGKLLNETTFQNATLERFDIGTLPKGIYIVSGKIDNKKMVTRICLQ